MKVIIRSATEVDLSGKQEVAYDIVKDDKVLASGSLIEDVDAIRDRLQRVLEDYKAKSQSENRLKVGDEIEV